eukprot:363049_1
MMRPIFICYISVFCIFLTTIRVQSSCIETYPDSVINYIINNADNDTENIYYLGNKTTATDCLNTCINFNYLCDKSLNNTNTFLPVSNLGDTFSWGFDNANCSIVGSVEYSEVFLLLTPNISANNYIIHSQITLSEGSDAGIAFKTKESEHLAYVVYLNPVMSEITMFHYTGPNGDYIYDYDEASPVLIEYNATYNLQVHIADNLFNVSLNGVAIYSSTEPFPSSYSSANEAGIYLLDVYHDPTRAIFHSFEITFPDSNDNDDELRCAAYVYKNDCYGYYGNDYHIMQTSISTNTSYDSGIVYETCPLTMDPTKTPSKSPIALTLDPTKTPSEAPSKSPIALTFDPTALPSDSPSKQPIVSHPIVAKNPTNAPFIPLTSISNDISTTKSTEFDVDIADANSDDGDEGLRIGLWIAISISILLLLLLISSCSINAWLYNKYTISIKDLQACAPPPQKHAVDDVSPSHKKENADNNAAAIVKHTEITRHSRDRSHSSEKMYDNRLRIRSETAETAGRGMEGNDQNYTDQVSTV